MGLRPEKSFRRTAVENSSDQLALIRLQELETKFNTVMDLMESEGGLSNLIWKAQKVKNKVNDELDRPISN